MIINSKLYEENVKFYTNKTMDYNFILSFAFKNDNVYKYSCDYLNIRDDRRSGIITNKMLKKIENIISQHTNDKCEYINENVVDFISSFTRGTVHGYASIWEFIFIT